MRYIEAFYNRWRPHTNNDGLPPATAMARFTTGSSRLATAAEMPVASIGPGAKA
jgi:hypothetical protein